MPTYYSYCHQFGDKFQNCPIKERGAACINCNNNIWRLREFSANNQENNTSNDFVEKENKKDC